jgi:hypothetical protein
MDASYSCERTTVEPSKPGGTIEKHLIWQRLAACLTSITNPDDAFFSADPAYTSKAPGLHVADLPQREKGSDTIFAQVIDSGWLMGDPFSGPRFLTLGP